MQALSFIVHIPLVCFGIAFPAMVIFVEWLHLRTGDELYLTLAKRVDLLARDGHLDGPASCTSSSRCPPDSG